MASKSTEAGAALLAELVAIDSVNPAYPGGRGEAALAERVAARCRASGLAVELREVLPGRPNVLARPDHRDTVRDPRRAGNVAFVDPNGGQTAALLARDAVHAWGGDGRVRVSIHLFNDATDVARLVAGIESARRVEVACD